MKIHILLFCLLSVICTLTVTAQEVKVNADGDKIVVYPDGSWRYLEPGETIDVPPAAEEEEPEIKMTPRERDEEFQARVNAVREAEKRERAVQRAEVELKNASQDRLNLETELAALRAEDSADPERTELLERRILKARNTERELYENLQAVQEEAEFYADLVGISQKKREKAIAGYEADKARTAAKAQSKSEKIETPATGNQDLERRKKSDYAVYDPKKDVILNPPKYQCRLQADETDEFTGVKRRTTEQELFFTYTREEIRPYYKGREHTVCRGNVTAMGGGIYVFSIEIDIASRTAPQEYGGIMSNGTLLVILLDGSTVTMSNNRTSRGKFDAVKDVYTFKGNYQIPPKQVDDLLDGEIDKIRVVWEQGYDTYDIYEPDFLRNHLSCVKD